MAYLKFNKAELVNLEYSLKREILGANVRGAYFNTSIIDCNTRKYHGLLVVPIEKWGSEKFVLLNALDESIILNGSRFNLGIHCYGDTYDPKGHKYIIDFNADIIPEITYKVGPVTLKKAYLMADESDEVMIRYTVAAAPGKFTLQLKPFLAYRSVHTLTSENLSADTSYKEIPNGVEYCMYDGFPALDIQTSVKPKSYHHQPYWYKGVTYSDEYRRGFDCREDLLVPGIIEVDLKEGDELVVSASTGVVPARSIKPRFARQLALQPTIEGRKDMLLANARRLKVFQGGKKKICSGYTWLGTGLLRETVDTLAGLTLYANGDCVEFEEILDNLIEDNQERLYKRTTQIEVPLALTDAIQQYIAFSGKEKQIWKKYGAVLKGIIESYGGARADASICPNGLLWCQKFSTALTWMNTYIEGRPVTERGGFQVEVNAHWYNALCFALEMEGKYGTAKKNEFIARWTPIRDLVKQNFQPTFLIDRRGYLTLADYVDNYGQHKECRPNMLWAVYLPYSPVDDQVKEDVLTAMREELVTRRGIRTLSPRCAEYQSVYEGSQHSRDFSSFNGSCRTSLLGPWEDVCFRLFGPAFLSTSKWLINGFFEDAGMHGIGMFSELYDADPPHEPHGAICSAPATAALMRCLYLIDKYSEKDKETKK